MQHLQRTGYLLQAKFWRGPLLTASLADPYPLAPLYREFPSPRNTTARRSPASPTPNASATSEGTGTGALFSHVPAAPPPAPGCARLYRHAAKSIRKAAATTESPYPA